MYYQGGFEIFKESTKYMFKAPDISDLLLLLFVFFICGRYVNPFSLIIYQIYQNVHASKSLIKIFRNLLLF